MSRWHNTVCFLNRSHTQTHKPVTKGFLYFLHFLLSRSKVRTSGLWNVMLYVSDCSRGASVCDVKIIPGSGFIKWMRPLWFYKAEKQGQVQESTIEICWKRRSASKLVSRWKLQHVLVDAVFSLDQILQTNDHQQQQMTWTPDHRRLQELLSDFQTFSVSSPRLQELDFHMRSNIYFYLI